MFPGGVDWVALDQAIPRRTAPASADDAPSGPLAQSWEHVRHQSHVTRLIESATGTAEDPNPPSLCGHVYRARCTLPGHGRRACFSRCALLVEHLGRCCCAMHNADPWAEPVNTDPMATTQTPSLAEDSNFGDLLTALAGNNAVEHALPLWRAGFKTLKMAIDAGKPALMREGLSASVAGAIVRGHPCVAGPADSADIPVGPGTGTGPAPSRPDHPTLAYTSRGKRTAADARLATLEARESALKRIDNLCYAKSARGVRGALWSTWEHFAVTHWGLQPIPLTVNLVRRMAASLREGGYRAVDQYFSRARQEHLRAIGEAPSDVVEDAIKMYTRACQRGIGPHTFKDSFRFEHLAGLRSLRVPPSREDITNMHDDQCMWPAAMVVMGTWWMARGIELSFALACHVRVNHSRREVGWLLAASKRDPQALGEERVHRCSCDEDDSLVGICPYHVTVAYLNVLRDHFGDTLHSAEARVPLFPDRSGNTLTKAAVIEAIRGVAAQAGEPLVRTDGLGKERHRFHEHVLRVTGAQFLARTGLELLLIQLFARWGSSAVLRYVQQAPLDNQQGVAGAAVRGLSLKDVDRLTPKMMKEFPDVSQDDVRKAVIDNALQVELREMSHTMLINYKALDERVMLIEASVAEAECAVPSPVLGVRRHRASKLHKVSVGVHDHAAQPVLTTACGWRYGGVPHVIEQLADSTGAFAALRCYRCFPEDRTSTEGTRLRSDESESSSAEESDSSSPSEDS